MPARWLPALEDRKRLERELSDARKKLAMGGGGKTDGSDGVRTVGESSSSPARSQASI